MKTSALGAIAVLGALSFASSASAQAVAVFGGGFGEVCWRAAFASTYVHMDSARDEAHWKANAIAACDDALASGALNRRDLAATYVNRGILEMTREDYRTAEKNFVSSIRLMDMPEAHVDLGSTLINMQQYEQGVKETELGLARGSKEPQRGYYNLGIAYERLGNLQKAYESYRQASLLDPNWQDPKDEMSRFVVQVQPVKQ